MVEIKAVYGYSQNNMWAGEILVRNGWFEGFICDYNSDYKNRKFIYGEYLEGLYFKTYKSFNEYSLAIFDGEYSFETIRNDGERSRFTVVPSEKSLIDLGIRISECPERKSLDYQRVLSSYCPNQNMVEVLKLRTQVVNKLTTKLSEYQSLEDHIGIQAEALKKACVDMVGQIHDLNDIIKYHLTNRGIDIEALQGNSYIKK